MLLQTSKCQLGNVKNMLRLQIWDGKNGTRVLRLLFWLLALQTFLGKGQYFTGWKQYLSNTV